MGILTLSHSRGLLAQLLHALDRVSELAGFQGRPQSEPETDWTQPVVSPGAPHPFPPKKILVLLGGCGVGVGCSLALVVCVWWDMFYLVWFSGSDGVMVCSS